MSHGGAISVHSENICGLFTINQWVQDCLKNWSFYFLSVTELNRELFFVISASVQQGEVESGTRRKIKRLLSFQRYCHASRLLRGLVPHTPGSLHLLDDDYLGQAAVRTHKRTPRDTTILSSVSQALTSVCLPLQHMLSKVGTWNFDIFLFDRLTNGEFFSIALVILHI